MLFVLSFNLLIYADDAVEVVDGKPRKVVEIVDDSPRKVVGPPRKRPAERPAEEILVKIEPEEVPSTPKKKKRKSRPGRSSPDTANLRKVVKNATRRRFFEECMNPDSILWNRTEGKKKADMNNLLFSIAAREPIDELYKENPGTLRSVPETKLRSIVKWQVNF